MALPPLPQLPGVTHRRVTARGVDFNVACAGPDDGPPVVLLHGWPQHHYAWRKVIAGLEGSGLRVLAPDLPGLGWSSAPPHRWAKEDVASDVLALLDALGIDRCVLVGHDWGGFTGWRIALRAPERLSHFVSVCMAHPWPPRLASLPGLLKMPLYQGPMAVGGVALHRRTGIVRLVHRTATKVPGTYDAHDLDVLEAPFRDPAVARTGRDAYRTFLTREVVGTLVRPERRRVRVPVTALCGAHDPVLTPAMMREDAIRPHADAPYRLDVVQDSGHFLPEERPDVVVAAIRDAAGLPA